MSHPRAMRGWYLPWICGALLPALLGFLAPARAGETDRQRAFFSGLEAFRSAHTPQEYRQAAEIFESILADGYENGAVLYNLGNAYFRAGEMGRAIAAYRRAARLRPRDGDIQANLQAAQLAAPGVLPAQGMEWWRRFFFWHDTISQGEREELSIAIWLLALLLAAARLLLRKGEREHAGAWDWAVRTVLLLALVCSADAALGYGEEVLTRRGVVVAEAQARTGDAPDYPAAFDRPLKPGAEFTLLESRRGWARVKVPGAGEAWLPEQSVTTY